MQHSFVSLSEAEDWLLFLSRFDYAQRDDILLSWVMRKDDIHYYLFISLYPYFNKFSTTFICQSERSRRLTFVLVTFRLRSTWRLFIILSYEEGLHSLFIINYPLVFIHTSINSVQHSFVSLSEAEDWLLFLSRFDYAQRDDYLSSWVMRKEDIHY